MIVVMSLWRNDANRWLEERAAHLLSKRSVHHDVRWLWVVGDSDDDTEKRLRLIAQDYPATVVRHDSRISGEDLAMRRARSSWTASQMFSDIHDSDDVAVLHESDLKSPIDVLDRLLSNQLPVAGWPTIVLGGQRQFYDIWAYRSITGSHFDPKIVPPSFTFEVTSFGSVWAAPGHLVRNRKLSDDAIVSLCRQWSFEGVRLWVDPTIAIEQPVGLWEAA